jgi:hypothetical protein
VGMAELARRVWMGMFAQVRVRGRVTGDAISRRRRMPLRVAEAKNGGDGSCLGFRQAGHVRCPNTGVGWCECRYWSWCRSLGGGCTSSGGCLMRSRGLVTLRQQKPCASKKGPRTQRARAHPALCRWNTIMRFTRSVVTGARARCPSERASGSAMAGPGVAITLARPPLGVAFDRGRVSQRHRSEEKPDRGGSRRRSAQNGHSNPFWHATGSLLRTCSQLSAIVAK